MNKELELLRIFRAAADCTSFRDAAARLGTSPQGVTRAIKELERHYDEILFHRSTRQIRITYFGIELLDQIRPILDKFEDLWRRPENNQLKWRSYYNNERTHQGKICNGNTPVEKVNDGKRVWAEKNLTRI